MFKKKKQSQSYNYGFDDGEMSVLWPEAKRKFNIQIDNNDDYQRGHSDGIKKGTVVFFLAGLFAIVFTALVVVYILPLFSITAPW